MQNLTVILNWPFPSVLFCFFHLHPTFQLCLFQFLWTAPLQRWENFIPTASHLKGPDLDWDLWLLQQDNTKPEISLFSAKIFSNGTTKWYMKKGSPIHASSRSLTYKTHQNHRSDMPVTLIHTSEFLFSHSLNISNVIHHFSD